MFRLAGLLALAALTVLAGSAGAVRVPSSKTVLPPTPGPRGDITVPYTTNGHSTLGVAQGVAPRIFSGPTLTDPVNKGVLPVYNLIFYGSKQSLDSNNPGALPRKPNSLRPREAR